MKKALALLLAAVLLLGVLTGCAGETVAEPSVNEEVDGNQFSFPTLVPPTIKETEEPESTPEPVTNSIVLPQLTMVKGVNTLSNPNMKYVMIYNPSVVPPSMESIPTRSTGSFGNQINPYMNRSEVLEEGGFLEVTPNELSPLITDEEPNKEGDRAGIAPVYSQGSTRSFYVTPQHDLNAPRIIRDFSCRYVGEHCYVWVHNGTLSDSMAQKYGQEFDANIYEQEVALFGEPRFADMGGKVHLLYYPMQNEFAGCFCSYDLYATGEYSDAVVQQYGLNLDHAIVHMNSTYAADSRYELSMTTTLAHEFQHLINGSDMFYTYDWNWSPSWINEAMSTYIETVLYPENKEENYNYTRLHNDYIIRHGQSLYNFNYKTPYNEYDFSVYDNVYLFANYLAALAGDDVFSNFHYYWRYSGSTTLSDIEAITNSVPDSVYAQVVNSVDDSALPFDEENAFMSKLTLQFYLDQLDREATDPEAFSTLNSSMLLYDEINPAYIENGGRIIVAVNSGTYTVPSDASTYLMYIGLDANFQPCTDLLYY